MKLRSKLVGAAPAALALIAFTAADAAAEGPPIGAERFAACLDGRSPTTQDVPAISPNHDADPFASAIFDTDPTSDELLVDFDDSVDDDDILELGQKWGLTFELNSEQADDANLYVARLPEGAVPWARDCLLAHAPDGWIEAAEENFEYQLLGAPNDPLYRFQWHMKQVHAEEAWAVSSGKGAVVAVIDTGVAVEDNPGRKIKKAKDLSGTDTVPGYDFVDKDAFPWDGHGHGTHVAGTIAQTTNNKFGVAGLAYSAKIMPLRVLNSRGFGQVGDIADSIRFAADNGAQVINMSLGGPLPSLAMARAVKYAHSKGVTVIAAAGNGGKRAPSYPAAYDNVVAVAATQFDKSTTFYSQWGSYVDIAAPGGNTRVDQNGDGRPDGVLQETLKDGRTDQHDFALYMGTSMASPHVAGAAALVVAQGITNPDKVEEVLKASADNSQETRFKDKKEYQERYGAGMLRADQAVKKATIEQGSVRLGGGLFLALLAIFGLRRREVDELGGAEHATLFGATIFAASGLFFLPLFFGDMGVLGTISTVLSRPIAEYDTLLGLQFHQNPILASAAIPVLAYGLLGGMKRLRLLAVGLALGFAGFCLTEAFLLTSDVQWIPGIDVLDRAWLVGNGLLSFAVGYFGLKRD